MSMVNNENNRFTIYTSSAIHHKHLEITLDYMDFDGNDFEFIVTGLRRF